MKEIEIEGKTVTMAVEKGLSELGLRRDQVEVEVLEQGSPGFLGIGVKPARVHIREKVWVPEGEARAEEPASGTHPQGAHQPRGPRPAREPREGRRSPPPRSSRPQPRDRAPRSNDRRPESRGDGAPQARPAPRSEERPRVEPRPERPRPQRGPEVPPSEADIAKICESAQTVIKDILSLAGLGEAVVKCAWDPAQNRAKAEVETQEPGLLIGKAGKTLESLQFLVTVIVGRRTGVPTAIQVECQEYWKKVEEKILSELVRAVEDVKQTGRPFRMEPMEPALRRLVHRKLQDDPDVETASEGEGPWRKVVIRPKAKHSVV